MRENKFRFTPKELAELEKSSQFLDEKKEVEPLSPIPGSPPASPTSSRGRSPEKKGHKRSRTTTPESKRDSSAPPSSRKSFSDIVESRESSAERQSTKAQKPADFIDDNRFTLLLKYLVKPLPQSMLSDLFLAHLYTGESSLKKWIGLANLIDNEKDIIYAYSILLEKLSQSFYLTNKINNLEDYNEKTLLNITLNSIKKLGNADTKKEGLAIIEEFLSNLFIQFPDDIREKAANLYLEAIKYCCHNFDKHKNIAEHFTHIDGHADFKNFVITILPGASEVLKAIPIIQLGGNTTSFVSGVLQNGFLAFIASSSILLPYLSQKYKNENERITGKYNKLHQLFDKVYENKLVQFTIENNEEILFIPASSAQQIDKVKLIFNLTWQLIANKKNLAKNRIHYDLKEVNFSIAIIRCLINRIISAHLIEDKEFSNLSPKNIAEISAIFSSLYLNSKKIPDSLIQRIKRVLLFSNVQKIPDSRILRMALDCYFFAVKKGKESELIADFQLKEDKHEEENSRSSARRKSISSLRGYRSASPPTSGARRESFSKQLIGKADFKEVPNHIKDALNSAIASTSQVEFLTEIYDNINEHYLSSKIEGGWLDGAKDWTDTMQHLANCVNNEKLYEKDHSWSFVFTFPAYYIASLPLLSTVTHTLDRCSYAALSVATSAISQVWQFYVQRYFFSNIEINEKLAKQFKERLQEVFKADLLRQVIDKVSIQEPSNPSREKKSIPLVENMTLSKISTEKSPSTNKKASFLLETDNSLKQLHAIIANVFIGLEEKSQFKIQQLLSVRDTACLTYYIFNQLSVVREKELILIKSDKDIEPKTIGKHIAKFLIDKKIIKFCPPDSCLYYWINRIIGARVDYDKISDSTFVTALRLARSETPVLEIAP